MAGGSGGFGSAGHYSCGATLAAPPAMVRGGVVLVSGHAGSGDRAGAGGAASHADRYTYLPAVGLSIMLAWGAAELAERWPRAKPAIAGLAAASCAACLCLAWFQVQYWENSITCSGMPSR